VDVLAAPLEGGDVRGAGDRPAEVDHADPLQGEQVALREHARQPAVIDHDDVAEALARHHQGGVVSRLLGAQGRRARRHHLVDRPVLVQGRHGDPGQHVVQGEHAHGGVEIVDHDHAADALRIHDAQHLPHGRPAPAGHRRAAYQAPQRGGEGGVAGDPRG
jgi:hypothetical protein